MTGFVEPLTGMLAQVPPVAAYAILATALLIESNLLFGVFVPTLTMMVTAGALARTGYLDLPVVIAVAVTSVVMADLISYHTGRYLGGRLRNNQLGRRISDTNWTRAEAIMKRHGGRAVLVARFIPLLRTLTPHLAGATGVPYRRVLPYSVGAATLWACAEAGGGYLAAHSIHRLSSIGTAVLLAAAAIALLITAVIKRRRSTPVAV